jgi:ribosomal protein S18 acetylase RimI-like enzyme
MAVKIRGIESSDIPHIISVTEATGAFLPYEIQTLEEIMGDYFKDPEGSGYYFYLAEQDGEVAGYLCYGPTPVTQGTWDMYWCAVSPGAQGKGIGSTLFKLAAEHIRSLGGRLILIETSSNPNYSAARSLYITLGYKLVSTIPDFYSPGDHKETFWKSL